MVRHQPVKEDEQPASRDTNFKDAGYIEVRMLRSNMGFWSLQPIACIGRRAQPDAARLHLSAAVTSTKHN